MNEIIKLYSLDINGVPIAYLDSYTEEQVANKEKFIITTASTVSSGYTDVSSDAISIINKNGEVIARNYQEKQKLLRLFNYEKGWDNLTHEEKDIIIKYHANPQIDYANNNENMQVISHQMSYHNMSINEASDLIIDNWHNHWKKFSEDCQDIWRDVVKTTVKFLSFQDSNDLLNTIDTLVSFYLSTGRLGIGYGESKDGILNYIRSDYGFLSTGLSSNAYVLKKGDWSQFEYEIEDSFLNKMVWDRIRVLKNI